VTDVSVVVIAHDVRDEVLRAFESVSACRGGLEVQAILVDNGSTDGTRRRCASAFRGSRSCACTATRGSRRATTAWAAAGAGM